jgi:hypothetical protein
MGITRVLVSIGLLLNAPYKIDSMVWMRMWIIFNFVDALRRALCGEGK